VKKGSGNEEVEVHNFYLSDELGNKKITPSQYVTLELDVHPDNIFTNPFKYSFETGFNDYEPIEYNITMLQAVSTVDDETIHSFILNMEDCTDILEPEASKFTNGTFDYEDTNYGEISLSYASFAPETKDSKDR